MRIISRSNIHCFTRLSSSHLSFRAEIRRLTKLLNETPSRRSSQMAELSEMDENIRDMVEEVPESSANPPPHLRYDE